MKTSSSKYIATIYSLSLLLFLSLPSTSLGQTSARCHSQDEKVLLEIKAALGNPYILAGWIPTVDCCDWSSVKCDEITGRVRALLISDGEVSGQIPEAVTKLKYLDTLVFSELTNLTGEIPSFLTKITRLKTLIISNTGISGPVPTFLGQIKTLDFLDLSSNKLSGTIPPSLAQLKNLSYLKLSSNKLTGTIPPSLSELPKIEYINLVGNKLTGTIPESFGVFKGSVPNIYLSHNRLTGTVPKSLGNLNFSLEIDLSDNKLEGDVSFLFGKNKTVKFVYLSKNSFEFDFSKVEFHDELYQLDVSHNKIFGSLPVGLTQLYLQTFNVSYNRLCGKIPTGGTGRLQERFDASAYSHNKCLCGDPLPPCKS